MSSVADNLVTQNLLIKVQSKIITPELIYLRGALKVHMPLDSMVAYVQEDEQNDNITKTFASIQSLSLQYKILLHHRPQQIGSTPEPDVLDEGYSVPKSSSHSHNSLVRMSDPIFTDLLSNDPLPASADTHQELQRCMHYEFELTCQRPQFPPSSSLSTSASASASSPPLSFLPPHSPDSPISVEFNIVAFCLRDDIPPQRGQDYIYFGPQLSVPLLPEVASGEGSIFAVAKPAYLIPLDVESMERRLEGYRELEMFLSDSDCRGGFTCSLKQLPKNLRLDLCL
jgi:hypothetical protein